VEKDGFALKSSTGNLKYVPTMKMICVNFSSVHQKVKTELWVSLTMGLWAAAATVHLLHNYGKDEDGFIYWVSEILIAGMFAAGFGWYLNRLVTLHRMEKRGELRNSLPPYQEF